MKLAIIGSRSFTDYNTLCIWADMLGGDGYGSLDVETMISGGAIGTDTLAERWADERGIKKEIIKPDYSKYPSNVAPLIRNGEIAEKCDMMLAFSSGVERSGTNNAIGHARRLKKPTFIFYF